MKTGEKYFLKIAQDLNISKAERTLYVSQQDLSRHIARLEKEYGVPLFYRKPVLALTPYGEALKQSLERIQIIEQGLEQQFQEIQEGTVGTIRFGIHFTRSRAFLPQVYTKFNKIFPHVEISVVYGESPQLAKLLLHGELDIMLGVNEEVLPQFYEYYITTENIFLVIPNNLLLQHFGEDAWEMQKQFRENGVNPEIMRTFPFISNTPSSQAQKLLNTLLLEEGIQLQVSLKSTDHYGNIFLAGEGAHVCCCPQTILQAAEVYNWNKPLEKQLDAYYIQGLSPSLRVSLLKNKESFLSRYMQTFIDIATEESLKASLKFERGLH